MSEKNDEPVFLSGGMRPGEPSAPVGLPAAASVLPGSVMLDSAGTRWRATDAEWVRSAIVTAREHRVLAIRVGLIGVAALAAFLVVAGLAIAALLGRFDIPVVTAAVPLITGLALAYAWTRGRRRLAAQDVVPESSR